MSSVIDVNADTWKKEVLEVDTLVVVDVWHERCAWCLKLNPIFSQVSGEYENRVKFAKLNALKSQENQQIAAKYGVMGTPTLIFFCDGRPVESAAGYQPEEALKQLVDSVIEKHQECIKQSTKLDGS